MNNSWPILLVEDDSEDCELIKSALTEIGITNHIECCTNGRSAFDFLKKYAAPVALIISDINMPMMNGIEFKGSINADPELTLKAIPFVYLTTSSRQADVVSAYKMHVQGYFTKPNSYLDLMAIMKTVTHYWSSSLKPVLDN